MPSLQAELDLQIEAALARLEELDNALLASAQRFGDALAEAVSGLAGTAGAVSIEADVAPAEAAVGDLVAQVEGEQLSLPVDAATDAAQSEVHDLVASIDGEEATVSVDADTSAADSAVSGLSDRLGGAGSSASAASDKVLEFAAGAEVLSGATKAATGDVAGLSAVNDSLGVGAGAKAAGIAALAGGIDKLAEAGIGAASAEQRFNAILGDTAKQVEAIHVGDLSANLFSLASRMGSTREATQNAAATIFQFAENANASKGQAAQFTQELFALASRAVALKPSLGDVSDVATRMEVGLGRARSAAQQFGISISQAEINTRAMRDTGKTSAAELTAYEKSVAGAEIALERYGSTLSGTVAKGTQNAAIQQRAALASIKDTIDELARPVVAPFLDVLRQAEPSVRALGQALAAIAAGALPVVSIGLQALGDVLSAVAGALRFVQPLIGPVVAGLLALKAAELAAAGVAALAGGLEVLAGALPAAGAAVETFAGEVAGASLAIESAAPIVGLLVGGVALLGSAFGLFGGQADAGTTSVNDFKKAVSDAGGVIDSTARKTALAALDQEGQLERLRRSGVKLDEVLAAVSQASNKQRDALHELSLALLKGDDSYKGLISRIREMNPALGDLLEKLARHHQLNTGLSQSLEEVARGYAAGKAHAAELKQVTQESVPVTDAATAAQAAYNKAIGDSTTGVDDFKKALEGLLGAQGDVTAADISLRDSQAQLGDSVGKNGATFDINTQAGRDNLKQIEAVVGGIASYTEAVDKQTGSAQKANDVLRFLTGALEGQLQQFGLTKEGADALIASFGLIPGELATQFTNGQPAIGAAASGAGTAAASGFGAGMAEGAPPAVAAGAAAVAAAINGAFPTTVGPAAAQAGRDVATALGDGIGHVTTGPLAAAGRLGSDTGNRYAAALRDAIVRGEGGAGASIASHYQESIANPLDLMFTSDGKRFGKDFINGIAVSAIATAGSTGRAAAAQAAQTFGEPVDPTLVSLADPAGKDFINGIAASTVEAAGTAGRAGAIEAAQKFGAPIDPTLVSLADPVGPDVVRAITDGMIAAAGERGRSAAAAIAPQIVDPVAFALVSQGNQIGIDTVNGIKDGMITAAGEAGRIAAAAVAPQIVDPLRGELGISSPSRVAAERIGLPIAQGIAVGISDGSSLVLRALRSATDFAGGGRPSFDASAGGAAAAAAPSPVPAIGTLVVHSPTPDPQGMFRAAYDEVRTVAHLSRR